MTTASGPAGGGAATLPTCASCGRSAEAADAFVWTLSLEQGAALHYCPDCARRHVRSIEAKLNMPDW